MKYNLWAALFYETTNLLLDADPRWSRIPWLYVFREKCKPAWIEWKTESTMKNVDFQTEVIKQQWASEEDEKYTKPIVIEYKPDGSNAQDLLGGTLEIKAPFYNPDEPSS
jgi:hypothetical protein